MKSEEIPEEKTEDEKKRILCYIIMPFSKSTSSKDEDYWNEMYEDFIKGKISELIDSDEILNQFQWDIRRSSVGKGGPLNNEIIWDLLNADIVIADITDLRPNVLYELGIRHSFTAIRNSGRTILIQDNSAFDPPFDLTNYAIIKYSKSRADTWKQDISERLRNSLNEFFYRDNPVSMSFAQHNYSFQQPQTQSWEEINKAMLMVEKMVEIGFDIEWIQNMVDNATRKDQ